MIAYSGDGEKILNKAKGRKTERKLGSTGIEREMINCI